MSQADKQNEYGQRLPSVASTAGVGRRPEFDFGPGKNSSAEAKATQICRGFFAGKRNVCNAGEPRTVRRGRSWKKGKAAHLRWPEIVVHGVLLAGTDGLQIQHAENFAVLLYPARGVSV